MRTPLAVASTVLLCVACASASKPAASSAAPKPAPIEVTPTGRAGEAAAVRRQTFTGTVRSVDMAARTVTLVGPGGETQAVRYGPDAKRVDELVVGDVVRVDVEQQLLLEVQPPGTPAVPLTTTGGAAPASDGSAPAAVLTAGVQATVTVTAVDLATRTVRFQDPAGASYEVKAGPGLRIEKLAVGDRLLATFVEATAVRVERTTRAP